MICAFLLFPGKDGAVFDRNPERRPERGIFAVGMLAQR